MHRRAAEVARARAYSSPWALESQQDLLRRIDEAGKYVPVASLALNPQCGFASVAAGNEISWDDQRRKLDLLVDTARQLWGE